VTSPENGSGAPLKVAYHLDSDIFGGVERYLLTLVEHLDRRRYLPVVIGRAPDLVHRELSKMGVEFLPMPAVASKWDVRGWRAILKSFRRVRPAVYHGMQSHSFSGQYALASAIATRTPTIVVTCHYPSPASNWLQGRLAAVLRRGVDVQVVPGEWALAELAQYGQLARRTIILPNGIDLPDSVSRQEARERLGVRADATVVGGLMRLLPYKRPELIVGLAQALPGITVVLFGEGPEREHLAAQAKGGDVVLTGFRPDAAALLPALDVFVHPCPSDNQPLAVLEAMARGIPAVVADSGGTAAMVEHERTGLLAPATAQGMTAAVKRLLDDPELADRLSKAAETDVMRDADPVTMARRIEALYGRDQGAL
jgi:glycosyltransferase involved in cell wall biosynthesis